MKTYYNEFDKKKCAMLAQLMKDGHITKGDIDDRSITDVRGDDLKDYTRCHFFAGIGLWDYALNLANWEEDRPVWTGSCPCQPFSSAGRQAGKEDSRHLWPEWLRLIEECSPTVVFGEQVSSAITKGWLDDVYQGLESQDYAVGAVVLPASSVGAPHRRERLWFVAQSNSVGQLQRSEECRELLAQQREWESVNKPCRRDEALNTGNVVQSDSVSWLAYNEPRQQAGDTWGECLSNSSTMGNTELYGHNEAAFTGIFGESKGEGRLLQSERSGASCTMGNTESKQSACGPLAETNAEQGEHRGGRSEQSSFWNNGVWLDCTDGKQRLAEPTIPLLANGYPARIPLLHAIGDGIVPQVAAEVIIAYKEMKKEFE